jgi:hypothetical protein
VRVGGASVGVCASARVYAHALVASACVCELIACARAFCVRACARVRACAGVLATHLAVLVTKSSTACLLFSSPKRVTPLEYTVEKEKQQRYPTIGTLLQQKYPTRGTLLKKKRVTLFSEAPYQRYPVE